MEMKWYQKTIAEISLICTSMIGTMNFCLNLTSINILHI